MKYAQLDLDGNFVRFLPDINLEWDSTHFCTPKALTEKEAAMFRVVPVNELPQPSIDYDSHECTATNPELVNGVWQTNWVITPLSIEELTRRARARIPSAVSPRQIRQALTRSGLRAVVEGAVAAGDQDTKDWWEFATVFERNHPLVVSMGAALGQDEVALDALFVLADSL